MRVNRCLFNVTSWIAVFTGGLSLAANAQGQQNSPNLDFGFQVFHSMLESRGLETTTDLRSLYVAPHQSVIVLTGAVERNDLLRRTRLRSFIDRGGAVLLATDHPLWVDEFCMLKGGPVEVDAADAYQDYLDCPIVIRLAESHRLNRSVDKLIANRAGRIEQLLSVHGHWQQLAYLPKSNSVADENLLLIASMQSKRSRRGRLLVVADHSLLINGMLMHGDNARFILNVADWLVEDGRNKLFIAEDGLPLSSAGKPEFDLSQLPPPPPPESLPPVSWDDIRRLPAEAWLPFGNKLLAAMEEADLPNEIAADRPRQMSDRLYNRALYIVAAVLAALYVLWQLLKRGKRVEPPVSVEPATGLDARVQQALKSQQFLPTIQGLTEDMFFQLSQSHRPADWQMCLRNKQIIGSWYMRWRIGRVMSKLFAIASHGDTRPITMASFRKLVRDINEIKELHKRELIRIPIAVPAIVTVDHKKEDLSATA